MQKNRSAWVDASNGANFGYCSSACARAKGANDLVGQWMCSVPGCVHRTLLNKHTGSDLGYCADSHLRHAASHPMVSDGPRTVLLLLLLLRLLLAAAAAAAAAAAFDIFPPV